MFLTLTLAQFFVSNAKAPNASGDVSTARVILIGKPIKRNPVPVSRDVGNTPRPGVKLRIEAAKIPQVADWPFVERE